LNELNHRGLKDSGSPGVEWPQLATYPQSPFSGPACCCDVAYLSQAFSQPTGPGRLWISLGASLLSDTSLQMTESNHELKQYRCYRCPDPKVLPMS
jgi:hypothetical protein